MSRAKNIQPTAVSVLEYLTKFANNNKRSLDTLVKQYMQERFLYKLSLLPDCQRKLVLQEYTLEEIKGAYLGDSSERFFRNLNFVWQAGASDNFIKDVKEVIKQICLYCDDCITHTAKYLSPVDWDVNTLKISYMQDNCLALQVNIKAYLANCEETLTFYIEPAWQKSDNTRTHYILAKYRKHNLPVLGFLTVNPKVNLVSLWPELSVYPLEYVIANKYYALFCMDPIRLKDVYDICFIQKHYGLNVLRVQKSISEIFDKNWLVPKKNISEKLQIPLQKWEAFLKENNLRDVPVQAEEVCKLIENIFVITEKN